MQKKLIESLPWSLRDPKTADYLARFLAVWSDAAAKARSLGMKVFAYDAILSEQDGNSDVTDKTAMIHRNSVMSKLIIELHAKGICKKSITINGAAHLFSNSRPGATGEVLRSLPETTKSAGLKTHSLFLMSSSYVAEDIIGNVRMIGDVNFKACPWQKSTPASSGLLVTGTGNMEIFRIYTQYTEVGEELSPFLFDENQSILIY